MRALQSRDVVMLGYLPVMAAISWLIPEPSWPWISTVAARMYGAPSRKNALHIARLLRARASELDPACIAAGLAANYHLARLQLLRCHRKGSWCPAASVVGLEHVERALGARQGAILWVAPFVFTHLITKMALNQAGLRVSHLSR
ncbi:MAG: hypothetical protein ACREV0_01285, partial [Burkholderiales bacterium]